MEKLNGKCNLGLVQDAHFKTLLNLSSYLKQLFPNSVKIVVEIHQNSLIETIKLI
jgi:hypothetical protein